MVEDDIRPDAAYYRSMAARLRTLAQQVTSRGVRTELLELAERFERMASWVEGRSPESDGQPG